MTLHPARFEFFTGPSSFVPSLHRQKVCIFKLFTPLALFSFATWSSTIFLASYSEPWIHGSFYYKHSCLYDLDFLHVTSTIILLLHRRMAGIFKLFTPLASFSYATWSSATFLASWSEPRICWIFYTPMVSITLQPVGLGLFTAPSPIVPSLHRLKPGIYKLLKPLASFSYAFWSTATFLACCIEPWTCWNFNTLIVSITLHPSRIEFFTIPSSIVPSFNRLKACIFKEFKPLASLSHVTWSSGTFMSNYSVSWTCEKFSTFYYITACTIWIFYRSVNDCTLIAPTKRLYFYTLQTSSYIFICYLI